MDNKVYKNTIGKCKKCDKIDVKLRVSWSGPVTSVKFPFTDKEEVVNIPDEGRVGYRMNCISDDDFDC